MAEDSDVDIQPITRADFVPAKVFRSRSMNTHPDALPTCARDVNTARTMAAIQRFRRYLPISGSACAQYVEQLPSGIKSDVLCILFACNSSTCHVLCGSAVYSKATRLTTSLELGDAM